MEIGFTGMTEDDLVACAELFSATFKESPWNEEWATDDAFERLACFLACPSSIAIKAVSNECIQGFLIGEVQQWNEGKEYYLKEMCVRGTVQRQGIGKGMMRELGKILKANGVSSIYLITHRNGIPSSFYSSLGFSENQDVMVMGKSMG